MSNEPLRTFIIIVWTTEDDREHHHTLNYETRERNIEETEKRLKKLWQESALTDKDSKKIRHMSVFEGVHVNWEKEEEPVVKKIKLTFEKDSPFPIPPKEGGKHV